MKKIAIFLLALILLSRNTGNVQAQLARSSFRFDAVPNANVSSSAGEEFNTNTKAGKDFARRFENATNAKWTTLRDGGSSVNFFVDGIQTRIFYNKKGNETGMLRYYTETELPADVRHQVRSVYYDFDIFLVTEVTVGNKTVYLVKVTNNGCTKTISVLNGEMDVVDEFDNL